MSTSAGGAEEEGFGFGFGFGFGLSVEQQLRQELETARAQVAALTEEVARLRQLLPSDDDDESTAQDEKFEIYNCSGIIVRTIAVAPSGRHFTSGDLKTLLELQQHQKLTGRDVSLDGSESEKVTSRVVAQLRGSIFRHPFSVRLFAWDSWSIFDGRETNLPNGEFTGQKFVAWNVVRRGGEKATTGGAAWFDWLERRFQHVIRGVHESQPRHGHHEGSNASGGPLVSHPFHIFDLVAFAGAYLDLASLFKLARTCKDMLQLVVQKLGPHFWTSRVNSVVQSRSQMDQRRPVPQGAAWLYPGDRPSTLSAFLIALPFEGEEAAAGGLAVPGESGSEAESPIRLKLLALDENSFIYPTELLYHCVRAEKWATAYYDLPIRTIGRENFFAAPDLSPLSLSVPGAQVDVLDTVRKWYDSTVLAYNPSENSVKVHFNCWSSKWDEVIPITSARLALVGSQCSAMPYYSPRVYSLTRPFYLGVPIGGSFAAGGFARPPGRSEKNIHSALVEAMANVFRDYPEFALLREAEHWITREPAASGATVVADVQWMPPHTPFTLTESAHFDEALVKQRLSHHCCFRLSGSDLRSQPSKTFLIMVIWDAGSGEGIAYARFGSDRCRY